MAWQYCGTCSAEINPTNEDILRKYVTCSCGQQVYLNMLDDAREVLIIEMYRDIQSLKADLKFIAMKTEVEL